MAQISEKLAIQTKDSHSSTPWAERLESIKAGAFGAVGAALMFGLLIQVNGWILVPHVAAFSGLPTWNDGIGLLLNGAIAKLSGFLFGITYRYIIRQDSNPHLKSGAVGAFGLVRGLALVEMGVHSSLTVYALGLLILESLVLFSGVRLILDWAISAKWLKPFQTDNLS